MMHLPSPRILPLTIFALGLLLAAKSTELVRAATNAAGGDASAAAATLNPTIAARAATTPPAAAVPPPIAQPVPVPSPDANAVPPINDGERTVLLELRQRRQELDQREAAVAVHESVQAAAEQKLGARIAELQALQKKLEALDTARKQREDASWQGLVKVYEAMKPRDAATIFNDLDMPVLLQVVDRMKDTKTAPVLAAMQPDKARDVTAQLAQMRTRRDTPSDGTGGG